MMARKFLIGLALLLALGVVAALFAPWKSWLEQTLKSQLAKQGVTGIDFTVDALGLEGITLKNITFNDQLTVNEMTVAYSVQKLLAAEINQLEAAELVVTQGEMSAQLTGLLLVFSERGEDGLWQGVWSVAGITLEESPYPLPPLSGKGGFKAGSEALRLDGVLQSADGSHHAALQLDYRFGDAEASSLKILQASLPWSGGVVSTRNADVYLAGTKRFNGTLVAKNISLDSLLESLTGGRASATGNVSGSVPLALEADGTPVVRRSTLAANAPGRITMAADAIPGDNAQLDVLRNVLANFQYKSLSIALESDAGKKLSARLLIEGSNPDMYEGRAVKLNVQLTGDVLSLLQQSVPSFTDPEQLLKQGQQ